MTRTTRYRVVTAGVALALLLGACGSDTDDPIEALASAAEPTTSVEADPPPESAAETPSEPTEVATVEGAEEEESPPAAAQPDELPVSGAMSFDWAFDCSMGPPLTLEPGDCETFGGYRIVRAVLAVQRTGTFEGTEQFHATFVVDADGAYTFSGISSFVGTVEGCGEGTVVYNTAGSGAFDLEQSGETGAPVSGPIDAIVYTATSGALSELDVFVDLTMTSSGAPEFDVTGTAICDNGDGELDKAVAVAAVLPASGVSAADAVEWTGPATFALGPTCAPARDLARDNVCDFDENFSYMPLFNTLEFNGLFDGEARFIGTNILSARGLYEHSGIIVFDGTVDGCGSGTIVMSNEAAGSIANSNFSHQRAFTPTMFDAGTLAVEADGIATSTGMASTQMHGSYSC